jgi:hypothetical protein
MPDMTGTPLDKIDIAALAACGGGLLLSLVLGGPDAVLAPISAAMSGSPAESLSDLVPDLLLAAGVAVFAAARAIAIVSSAGARMPRRAPAAAVVEEDAPAPDAPVPAPAAPRPLRRGPDGTPADPDDQEDDSLASRLRSTAEVLGERRGTGASERRSRRAAARAAAAAIVDRALVRRRDG